MPELTVFQDAFCAALQDEVGPLSPWLLDDEEPAGLSVYRNTVVKGAVDALLAIYPTVVQMVGEEWFRAAAVAYARNSPPTRPALLDYGGDFAEWLASFPPAQDAPYLAPVAVIDGNWQAAYFAAEAEPLQPEAFAGLRESDLAQLKAELHPSAQLAAFDQNIVSLWLAHQGAAPSEGFELSDAAERMLIVRPGLTVEVRVLDVGTHAFLKACAVGESLLSAAELALAADPSADFTRIVATSLEAGVFTALAPIQGSNPHDRTR